MPFACPAFKPPAAASGSGSGHNGEMSAAAVSAAVGGKVRLFQFPGSYRHGYFVFFLGIQADKSVSLV